MIHLKNKMTDDTSFICNYGSKARANGIKEIVFTVAQ